MDAASPNDVAGLCQSARQHLQDGQFQTAADELRRAAGLDPDNAESYGLLGIALTRQGDVEGGLRAFDRAVQLDPRNADRRYNHAIALEKAGKTEAAVDALTEGLRIQSSHVRIREALGRLRADVLAAPTFDMPTSPAPPPPQAAMAPGGFPQAAPAPPPQPPYPQQPYAPQPLTGAQPPPPPSYGQPGYAPQPLTAGPAAIYGQPTPYPQQQQAPYGQPPYPTQPPYGGRYGAGVPLAPPGPDPGFWSFEHVTQILTEPSAFFAEQKGYTNYWPPIAFLMVQVGIVGGITSVITIVRMMSAAGASGATAAALLVGGAIGFCLGLALGLGIAIAIAFVIAGINHLAVMLFGGKGGYPSTFRTLVYASVPTVVCNLTTTCLMAMSQSLLIPGLIVLGIGCIWCLWVSAIGYVEVHELSVGRAIGAVLVPGLVLGALFVLLLAPVFMNAYMRAQGGQPYGGSNSPFGAPSSGFGGPTFGSPGPMMQPNMPGSQAPNITPPSFPRQSMPMMGPRGMGPMGPGNMGRRFGPMGGPSMGGRTGPMGP